MYPASLNDVTTNTWKQNTNNKKKEKAHKWILSKHI